MLFRGLVRSQSISHDIVCMRDHVDTSIINGSGHQNFGTKEALV